MGQGLSCMWDLPGSGIEPASPAFSRQTLPPSHQGDPCSNFFQSIFFPLKPINSHSCYRSPFFLLANLKMFTRSHSLSQDTVSPLHMNGFHPIDYVVLCCNRFMILLTQITHNKQTQKVRKHFHLTIGYLEKYSSTSGILLLSPLLPNFLGLK